ncbi:N-acetyltransferase [Lederbergia sp. NSJ-179]|uniref:N-acetyltransferase n=1 Tax=Lederbergia sp. NSJ-179 TaxID=2931402 RepID=UPI001FD4AA35|nr:N-acetyltransferase [Lederbergia sp. NSJ-179]MCJ7839541.1 N-acetyltransferase [Lederbergia sp. NSJ-179]
MGKNVQKLKINFKTLDEFKKFKEFGLQELSMIDDLQANMIEDDSHSPFYGIYFGDKLVARMSLYQRAAKFDQYFNPPQDYLELWKLEVLSGYQNMGYGKALIEYAKSYNMPIKTNPRMNSRTFFERMGFEPVTYEMARDRGENPLVWYPKGVTEQ